ncbi:hypothetical protein A6M27_18185 [Acidithiobacillus thiooxidans]|uniref:Uncharacterized protein n=1 Tax=Acidithiobacillus thiooxidans TaxID=930 RepID=A0A1C2J1V2_ACITH|nr:hypothetical protein [Acidithiobacillus thiooxidans]OCX68627.1 hypothetical protein A6P07_17920 [Acidithiobacillus thiooxidans]OCX78149.1 hypothetical protein A6O24_05170 [Acidithiobacillus thiooxidans]OCX82218.1 hypothetical protein A6O26_10540 [Acidithiobacillus thiooxidans]OCX83020.1 hypothetical protein A6M27_18185 [Acidithiobacillus thiooxidans]OFC50194.1 hypothetical protein BAE47_02375 [Acidithiobacillus thiooxidans]
MKKLLRNTKGSVVELAVITGCFLLGYLLAINAYAIGKFAEAGYPHYSPAHHVWFIWTLLGRVSLGLIAMLIGSVVFVVPVVSLLGVIGKTFRYTWPHNLPK